MKLKSGATLAAQIYDFLRRQIVSRRMVPGTPLSESDLAAHFNVSRQPVHEALGRLRCNGLVDILPQKGTFVSRISISNLIGICFMRTAIECQAVRASPALPPDAFKKICGRLVRCLEQQKKLLQSPDVNGKFLDLDDAFHQTICDLSQTPMAWEVLYNIKGNLDRIRYLTIGTLSDPAELIRAHDAILRNILSQDLSRACELIEKHSYEITRTYRYVRERNQDWFLEEEDEPAQTSLWGMSPIFEDTHSAEA